MSDMKGYVDVSKCTPGKWVAIEESLAEAIAEGGFDWVSMGHGEHDWLPQTRVGTVWLKHGNGTTGLPGHIETTAANAALIAEAGTVAHETGLSPRQLAERVKALEEALMVILDEACCSMDGVCAKQENINKALAALATKQKG